LIAELRTKKSCETAIADLQNLFRNSATFRSLLAVALLSSPFSSAQDGFKNQLKIVLELSVSLETKNLSWSEALKLRTSEKIVIAELPLRSNISLKSCWIALVEGLPSSCGIAIAHAHLCS
jgi:hypothetical protein